MENRTKLHEFFITYNYPIELFDLGDTVIESIDDRNLGEPLIYTDDGGASITLSWDDGFNLYFYPDEFKRVGIGYKDELPEIVSVEDIFEY